MNARHRGDRGPTVAAGRSRGTVAAGRLELCLENPGHHAGLGLRRLRPWLRTIVEELAAATLRDGNAVSLAVRLTSDRAVRRLNAEFRDRDETTDVLSFPGDPTPEGVHLGDIVLSVPTARRQAAQLGHSVQQELETLLLHGLLHCLGHDHETDDGAMDRLERRLRRRWVSNGR